MNAIVCPSCRAPLPFDVAFCPRCGAPSPAVRSTVAPREVPEAELRARLDRALGDGFEVRRLLCRGARADVFEVWERSIGRRLAVKVLRPDVEWTAAMIAAFKAGTGVIARLNHPNILPVHFVGEGEGLVYYARPFVEGQSLDWRIRTGGPLPLDEALALANQLLQALHHAHGQGVVHGGVKPANILLDAPTGRPLLADFGVARLADCAPARDPSGERAGAAYEAPEQRDDGHPGDARADVYGIGAVLLQSVTALLPTEGNPFAPPPPGVRPRADRAEPPVESLPRWLADAIARAVSRRPSDRYESASAFREALLDGRRGGAADPVPAAPLARRLADGGAVVLLPEDRVPAGAIAATPAAAPRPGAPSPRAERPEPRPRRRRRVWPWLLLLLLVAAGAFAAWRGLTVPKLVVTNQLSLPVGVIIGGTTEQIIEPGASLEREIPRVGEAIVTWEMVRPRTADGAPIGEGIRGGARLPARRGTVAYMITSRLGDTTYFAPLITNGTGVALRVRVNAGSADARDCACAVPPGAVRAPIGYYRLYANSSVEARDTAGRVAVFRDLGAAVDARSGSVGLRFDARDLRPAPRGRGAR